MNVKAILKDVEIVPCSECEKIVLRHFTSTDDTKIWISCFKCGHEGEKASSLRGAMKNWRDEWYEKKNNV